MRTESYDDPAMEELAAARDSDELCRLLVRSPWGWGSSTRHGEAVSLLRGLRGGTLPGLLVALLLCTCRRWDRVTAKLIAAVEECGALGGPDLDELAESLLSDEELRRPYNGCRPGGARMRIAGRWRITEAELWDCDALNLVAPAFIEFAEDGSSGSFGFIAVQ